ncbi:MAG: hypothetical protein K2L99_02020 [Muribaculaceae bacterium]|nr:hypothetical protein [Muribaculaceae bacterium]
MKDFIVYTSQGTTYGPNINENVENCQVLGIVQAHTCTEAINILFENNKWIQKAGFTKEYTMVKQILVSQN